MPFKDEIKNRIYQKGKQQEIRQAAKQTEIFQETVSSFLTEFKKQITGRKVYPLEDITPENTFSFFGGTMPIMHITFDPTDSDSVIKAADKLAREEDLLILTGDHKDWASMGIQGLSTIDGHIIFESTGSFFNDIKEAMEKLSPEYMDLSRYAVITNFRVGAKTPIVLGINYYYSPYLLTKNGERTNMIVMKTGANTCHLKVLSDVTITMLSPNKAQAYESLIPIISTPKNICEVTNLPYTS